MTTAVEDPSKYGVVLLAPKSSQIDRFVEKPQEYVGNQINAGIYIFNPSMLARIGDGPMSIEKDVFPKMAADGQLHATPLEGFWADVGQPFNLTQVPQLGPQTRPRNPLIPPISLRKRAHRCISKDWRRVHQTNSRCKIGPNVVIGADVTVGDGVRLVNCVLMRGSSCKDYSRVKDSIIGWHSSVGRWSRLDNTTILGEDVHIKDEVYTNGATVLPHKSVKADINEPQIVM
jgi:mannose-1-phosphate guanylyltransferase